MGIAAKDRKERKNHPKAAFAISAFFCGHSSLEAPRGLVFTQRHMTRQQAVNAFRWTALAEAVSYLVLLGIAMPLKYLWQMPLAVKIVGALHGGLFVLFCITLLFAMQKAAWPLGRAAMLFLASLLPLVPFWLDRRVKSWAEDAA